MRKTKAWRRQPLFSNNSRKYKVEFSLEMPRKVRRPDWDEKMEIMAKTVGDIPEALEHISPRLARKVRKQQESGTKKRRFW